MSHDPNATICYAVKLDLPESIEKQEEILEKIEDEGIGHFELVVEGDLGSSPVNYYLAVADSMIETLNDVSFDPDKIKKGENWDQELKIVCHRIGVPFLKPSWFNVPWYG